MDHFTPSCGFLDVKSILEKHFPTIEEDSFVPSPEDALYALLDESIDRFGYVARDIFRAILSFSDMTQKHDIAFQVSFQDLRNKLSALVRGDTNRILDP